MATVLRTCIQCEGPLPDQHPQRRYCSKRCKWAADAVRRADWRNAYFARYRAERREKAREYARAWRRANPDKQLAANRKWYAANKQRVLDNNKRWREENPERAAALSINGFAKRRAAKASAESVGVRPADWLAVLRRYNHRCAYCGSPDEIEMDHVIPLSRGGRHSIGNVLPACRPCNRSKWNLLLVEWRRPQG